MEQESKTKREVSDDDVSSDGEMKQPKSRRVTKSIHIEEDFIQTIDEALQEERKDKKKAVTKEDFIRTIDEALQEQRINKKKAERLHECLQSGDWADVAFSLLCEQIHPTGDLFLCTMTASTSSFAPTKISSPPVDLDFLKQIEEITDGEDVGEDVLYTKLAVPRPGKV